MSTLPLFYHQERVHASKLIKIMGQPTDAPDNLRDVLLVYVECFLDGALFLKAPFSPPKEVFKTKFDSVDAIFPHHTYGLTWSGPISTTPFLDETCLNNQL